MNNHKGKDYEYKRLVSVFTNDKDQKSVIDPEIYMVDQVELNGRLYNLKMEYELCETADVYILFSYAALYSFICPILPLLLFINNILTLKASRTAHLNLMIRKPLLE